MANPEKFQSMTLGSTDQDFSFVVNGTHIKKSDDIDLLRPIYTVRLCSIRQAYDRPTT